MKIKFTHGYNERNFHGTQKKGEEWNKQTVKGWKAKIVKLETIVRVGSSGTWKVQSLIGRSLIIYRPNGGWWHFDVYLSMTVEG